MHVCTMCACSAHRGKKVALDPLELTLKMVENLHVDSGNGIQIASAYTTNKYVWCQLLLYRHTIQSHYSRHVEQQRNN